MTSLASAFALLLSLVFFGSAVAKLRDRPTTASGFRSLGLRHAFRLVPFVAAVEFGLAGVLVAVPRLGGVLGFVTLAAFTAILVRARRRDSTAFCGCFGAAGSEPISRYTFARNAALMGCSLGALWATSLQWSLAAIMVVSTAAVGYLVAVSLVQMAERTGSIFPTVVPGPNPVGGIEQRAQVGR